MESKILDILRKAKIEMKKENFEYAKKLFLDAAEVAVDYSKKSSDEDKEKYRKMAKQMIGFAKNAKDSSTLTDLQENIDENLFRPDPPNDITFKNKESKIPQELSSYLFRDRSDRIKVLMGKNGDETIYWEPGQLMNGIQMIVGGSGSGKTEWLKSLAIELIHQGYPVLILDLHGDIELEIPTLSIDYRGEFGINPLELLSTSELDGGPEPQIHRLMEMFDDAVEESLSATQKAFLNTLLQFTYTTHGIQQTDPKTWKRSVPTFEFIEKLLEQPDSVLNPKSKNKYIQEILATKASTIAGVKNRLLPILKHPAFTAKYDIPIQMLTEKPLKLVLKPLGTVSNQFIVTDTILRQLFSKLTADGHVQNNEDTEKFRVFVVIDEVKILAGYKGKLNHTYQILNRLATEARKFGMGLILASQSIRHFGRDVQANSASKLILRAMDSDEAKECAKELELKTDQVLELDKPGLGFYMATNIIDPIKLQLEPSFERPLSVEE